MRLSIFSFSRLESEAKELLLAAALLVVGLIFVIAFNLFVDPFDSRIIGTTWPGLERTSIQSRNWTKWDFFQIRRAIRQTPTGGYDAIILGDSRGRQLSGGNYSERAFEWSGRKVLEASLVARQFSDYTSMYPLLRGHLKPGGTILLLVSFHSLGSFLDDSVAKTWNETALLKYASSYNTLLDSFALLLMGPPALKDDKPSDPEETIRDAQSVQRVRAEGLSIGVAPSQIGKQLDDFMRTVDSGHKLVIASLPIHKNLIDQIESSPKIRDVFQAYKAHLHTKEHSVDLDEAPCEYLYSDGVHYKQQSVDCIKDNLSSKL